MKMHIIDFPVPERLNACKSLLHRMGVSEVADVRLCVRVLERIAKQHGDKVVLPQVDQNAVST